MDHQEDPAVTMIRNWIVIAGAVAAFAKWGGASGVGAVGLGVGAVIGAQVAWVLALWAVVAVFMAAMVVVGSVSLLWDYITGKGKKNG